MLNPIYFCLVAICHCIIDLKHFSLLLDQSCTDGGNERQTFVRESYNLWSANHDGSTAYGTGPSHDWSEAYRRNVAATCEKDLLRPKVLCFPGNETRHNKRCSPHSRCLLRRVLSSGCGHFFPEWQIPCCFHVAIPWVDRLLSFRRHGRHGCVRAQNILPLHGGNTRPLLLLYCDLMRAGRLSFSKSRPHSYV